MKYERTMAKTKLCLLFSFISFGGSILNNEDNLNTSNYLSRRLFTDLGHLNAVSIEWSRSMNSVGWRSDKDPKHDNRLCINPPPFGKQCTVHLPDALGSCIAQGCKSVVCPDQKPYSQGKQNKNIKGSICQLRNHAEANEINHGMCKPSGCTTWSFHRGSLISLINLAELRDSDLKTVDIRTAYLALLIPRRLLDYECRGSVMKSCSCFDLSAVGQVIFQQDLISEEYTLCLLSALS